MPRDLSAVISRVEALIQEKSGRPIDIHLDAGENRLICASPYDDPEKTHAIFMAETKAIPVVHLGDLLRVLDHAESTRIFDLPDDAEPQHAALVYGLYTTTVGQRVLHALVREGIKEDGWAPFVSTYHNYRGTFFKAPEIPPQFKGYWDLIAAHAYADAKTACEVAKIPSARQAVKTIKNNKSLSRAVTLGERMSSLLLDFEDSRDWTERTFLNLLDLAGLGAVIEIREATSGKILQAPRKASAIL